MAVQRDKVIANAEKLVAKGKIEPAIKEYERLLDDNPNDVNTLNRIGDLWVRINRNDEAVKTFGKIADHYSKDGFFLKAIAIYKKINKLDPSKLDVYAKLADLYAKQGLAMEAKSQYQVLADYYLKHGEPANALPIYRKIAELDPGSINVHVKLADLHSQIGQTAEALKEYDRVGRMLLKRGMLEEAVQVFKKALKIDAKNVDLVESLVTALIDAKNYDNAKTLVEQALETNRDNPRLLALWGRILLAKGDVASARNALERGVKSDPNDPLLREALADLYLKQNDVNRALEMLAPLVERALGRGERSAAVEMLQRPLRIDSGHTATLERLVALYTRLNEETNILSSMNSLAEAHIARGQYAKASEVLESLIQREPQNAQHRTKLQFVRSNMSGGAPAEPAPRKKTAPGIQLPPMEVSEPEPSFDFSESAAPEISLDDSGPAVELDFSSDTGPSPAAQPSRNLPAVEIAAMEVETAGDDLDFITEHLTEAEVFAKYGLAEKAAEHLRAIIDRTPTHLQAHERLVRILLDEGEMDAAKTAGLRYAALLQEKGETASLEALRNDFIAQGVTLPVAEVAAEPSAEPAIAIAHEEEEIELTSAAMEEDAVLASDLAEPEQEISFDLDAGSAAEEVTVEELAEPEELPAIEPEPEPQIAAEEEISVADSPAASEPFYGVEGLAAEAEAEAVAEEPAAEEEPAADFDLGVEEEAETPEPEPIRLAEEPAAPAKPIISRSEIDEEVLGGIDAEEDIGPVIPAPAPAPPAAAAPAPVFSATPVQEENLFADENDFFDLAAELESELGDAAEEDVSLAEEEQSLEEIFKEFKKGVEQQLDSEDYDTHYNLGIAYKEMGLIDEAIGEFQLASKDPKRAVECASMLGLCFLEKGMPQLAIKWYRKGLEMPGISDEEHIGLLYDLGSAYVEVGDSENAQKALMEVYGLNSTYRDIATRIKQLENVRR